MKTTHSKIWFLVLICLILGSLSIPALAQFDPTAVPTVQQPVVTVPLQQVQQPVNQTTESQTPKFLSLTLGEALAILLGTVGLFIAIGKILWDANQNPGGPSVDDRVTTRIQESMSDRTYIEALERAHVNANAAVQKALDSTVGILQIIAPQSGLKMDDALLKFLQDIQKPGAPMPDVDVTVNNTPIPLTEPVDISTRGAGSQVYRFEAQTPLHPQNPLPGDPQAAG